MAGGSKPQPIAAAVDRAVNYAAPWVPLANPNDADFLSADVSNYQYNPFLGMPLDQLHIHRPAALSSRSSSATR